jgi:hypothetical protein
LLSLTLLPRKSTSYAASGEHKPAVIYMTGGFVESSEGEPGLGEPRRLQKPFRVSDVLAALRDVFTASPAEKVPG